MDEEYQYQMKDVDDDYDQFNSSFNKKNYIPGAPLPFATRKNQRSDSNDDDDEEE